MGLCGGGGSAAAASPRMVPVPLPSRLTTVAERPRPAGAPGEEAALVSSKKE